MTKLDSFERIAAFTGLEKLIKAGKAQARAECDGELLEDYQNSGYKKRELRLNGHKVGEMLVTMSKPEYMVTDKEAFSDFGLTYGLATLKKSISPWMVDRVISILEEHLEPDELETLLTEEVVTVPGWDEQLKHVGDDIFLGDSPLIVPGVSYTPETVTGTRVTGCKPEEVITEIRQMEGVEQLLLGGADE